MILLLQPNATGQRLASLELAGLDVFSTDSCHQACHVLAAREDIQLLLLDGAVTSGDCVSLSEVLRNRALPGIWILPEASPQTPDRGLASLEPLLKVFTQSILLPADIDQDALLRNVSFLAGMEDPARGRLSDPKPGTGNALHPSLRSDGRDETIHAHLYSSLVEALPVLLYRTDTEGRITFANQALLHEMRLSLSDLLGKTAHDFYPQDLADKYRADDRQVMETRTPLRTIEENVNPAEGVRRYVEVFKVPIVRDDEVMGVQGIFWDVTSTIQAQDSAHRLLAEKQILLRELHHRVRNNIASLSSLVQLQQASTTNREAMEALEEVIQILGTMGALYDHLLPGTEKEELSLKRYLDELIASLNQIYGMFASIRFSFQAEDRNLSGDRLVGMGIILNELVTNSVKHGRLEQPHGSVHITLDAEGAGYLLSVKDNGLGICHDVIRGERTGFGLSLVRMLTDQWGGKLSIENHDGTRVSVRMPLESQPG